MPWRVGPRKQGQFSADAEVAVRAARQITKRNRDNVLVCVIRIGSTPSTDFADGTPDDSQPAFPNTVLIRVPDLCGAGKCVRLCGETGQNDLDQYEKSVFLRVFEHL
jgi:hypothetical protein